LAKYWGAFTLIQSKSLLTTDDAPIVFLLGPFSIMTAQAYLGFSYGKNPTDQE
jgi:hypothetical protein